MGNHTVTTATVLVFVSAIVLLLIGPASLGERKSQADASQGSFQYDKHKGVGVSLDSELMFRGVE